MCSFHIFNLPLTYLPFIGSIVSFSNSRDSISFQIILYWDTLLCLENIKWHWIGRVFIMLWHAITKCIFRRLDKPWYRCFIDLIAYNITAVLSIIAWHFIRDHHLVDINRGYINYSSLPVKVFGCNLFLIKFKHLLFVNIFLISVYQIIKNNYMLLTQLFYLFSLAFWHAPIPPGWWMPSKTHWLFFYFFFLGLTFLIDLVPLNTPTIIVIIIIIFIPHIHLLWPHKPISDIYQRGRVFLKCFIAHLLCYKVIWNIAQVLHMSCVLRWLVKQWSASDIIPIISLHTSWILRCSGTNRIMHSLLCTTSLHISWVLRRSGT